MPKKVKLTGVEAWMNDMMAFRTEDDTDAECKAYWESEQGQQQKAEMRKQYLEWEAKRAAIIAARKPKASG